jgi:hypothetical protein
MKPRDLVKRIEALEERTRSNGPFREPRRHQVHGATKRERDEVMRGMIERGEAAPDGIFFLIVPANDETVRKD